MADMDIIITNVDYVITAEGVLRDQDIRIGDGLIEGISPHDTEAARKRPSEPNTRNGAGAVRVIEGRGRAALAGLKNAHTHAAMTLLRGYGDDMRLQPWLQERIWPAEAKLTPEDIYWGTRLAALEMIRSGTTFANDMYFQTPECMRAFRDSGIRAAVGYALFDFGDPDRRRALQAEVEEMLANQTVRGPLGGSSEEQPGAASPAEDPPGGAPSGKSRPGATGKPRVFPTIAPHSIYTCSAELLQWAADIAVEFDLVVHTHMSETEQEVQDCLAAHGVRPFQWLYDLGVLDEAGRRMVAAHSIWLDKAELDLVARFDVTVVHNPASNMKLASGCFPWHEYARRHVPVMLAPDGVASNNNLDMFDEMKLAALLQKHHYGDPTRLPAEEILAIATGGRSGAFERYGVGGALQEGGPADLILVDLDHPQMTPVHNVESNLAYAANGSVVETVICAGEVLMEDRTVPGWEEVLREARRCAAGLAVRARG
jgi:5-methylthioadenosine/S-adenosylhomocysteine deaminase